MPTVLDIIRRKQITNFVWRDVRKIDGTALHVWKNRSKRVLSKRPQMLNGKEIPLINFPDYYSNTISSIIAYHFVRKEKKRRKQLQEENGVIPVLNNSKQPENAESRYSEVVDADKKRKKRKRIVVKKKLTNNYSNNYYKPLGIDHRNFQSKSN